MSDNYIYWIISAIYLAVLLPDFIKLGKEVMKPQKKPNFTKLYTRLHALIFIGGITTTVLFTLTQINIFDYRSPIPYSEIESIGFADFRGMNLTGHTVQGNDQFASIATNLEVNKFNDRIEVTSFFHPSRSFVFTPNLKDEKLLAHELLHFKITEKWARLLRKELTELDEIPDNKALNQLISEIHTKLSQEQVDYDKETNHSYLLGNQLDWEKRIEKDLQKLDAFAAPSVRFP